MFKNYFKTAWRSIWKNKTTSLINIAGLSVGMTAAILIFVWVQNEISFDNYHKHAGNIYRLTTNLKSQGWIWETTPLLLADAVKEDVPEIEKQQGFMQARCQCLTLTIIFLMKRMLLM